jgi:hypothetical protein
MRVLPIELFKQLRPPKMLLSRRSDGTSRPKKFSLTGSAGAAQRLATFGGPASRGITLHLLEAGAANGWKAHDIWSGTGLGPISDEYKLHLNRHASLLHQEGT